MKIWKVLATFGLLPALILGSVGCETMNEHKILSGSAIGGATGALAGAVIGHQSGHSGTGALIGAAAGAAVGGGVGYLLDRQEKKFKQINDMEVERVRAEERSRASGRVEVREHLILRLSDQVLFERGSAALSPEGTQKLQEVARVLKDYPDSNMVVRGYASAEGSAERNQELSERRANNVKNALIDFGVASERLNAVGLGSTTAMGDNTTASGRAINRRVEIEVIPQSKEGGGAVSNDQGRPADDNRGSGGGY